MGPSLPQESARPDGRRLGKEMSRDEIQKLLGGYATGTLTAAEQEALFAAALDDQELFDALAREQSLRDLLRDPAAKAHLLSALDEKPKSRWAPWWRPAAIGLSMAALTVVVVRQIPPTPRPEALAVVEPKSAPAAPAIDQPVAPRVRPVESEPASRILEDKAKVVARDKEVAPASE